MASTTSAGPVRLGEKSGTGVGATVQVFTNNAAGTYVGALTYHDGSITGHTGWQCTDSSRVGSRWDELMAPALALARRTFPQG